MTENMVKVFIVDDEEIIRNGLCNKDWDSIEVECTGSAENGLDALEKIKKCKPDIVISDVRMPKADGIWLAQKLQNIMPSVRVVFLTGFDEFEYAQKAITLNVKEYLLKPIQSDILFKAVEKIKKEVENDRNEQVRKDAFVQYVKESSPFLKDWFLNLLKTSALEDELYKKLEIFGIELYDKGVFTSVVISFHKEEENFSLFEMYKEINNILSPKNIKLISFFDGMVFTYVFNFEHEDEKEMLKIIYKVCEELKEYLDYNYSGTYNIGIGVNAKQLRDIEHSVNTAIDACKYNNYLGDNQIIFIRDMEPLKRTGEYKVMIEEDYATALKIGSEKSLEAALTGIFDKLKKEKQSLDYCKYVCLELIINSSKILYELGQKQERLFKSTDLWSVINGHKTIDNLYEFILDINKVVISCVRYSRNAANENLIKKAKQIIISHFASDSMSLEFVAEQVYVSPGYLSNIFSKVEGETFKEHLIKIRIDKAKELIMDGNMKVHEITKAVGYNDYKHFNNLFKRTTGHTPTEWRQL